MLGGAKCLNGFTKLARPTIGLSARFAQAHSESPFERFYREQREKLDSEEQSKKFHEYHEESAKRSRDEYQAKNNQDAWAKIRDAGGVPRHEIMLKNLGLESGLYKQSELTAAYHQKCKEMHPDVLGDKYDETAYLELKPSLEYLINHGYYKIDTSWKKTGHYTCKSWADGREDNPNDPIYHRESVKPPPRPIIERDWVPPDERYKGPTWWDLPGRMLNPRLGRSFIGVWNETWEWKVERGAKRNIVEHLLITGWWYFFWSVAFFMALPYFGYLMRWLNYKSYGTPIPEQYQWQNVSPRLPFGLDSRY